MKNFVLALSLGLFSPVPAMAEVITYTFKGTLGGSPTDQLGLFPPLSPTAVATLKIVDDTSLGSINNYYEFPSNVLRATSSGGALFGNANPVSYVFSFEGVKFSGSSEPFTTGMAYVSGRASSLPVYPGSTLQQNVTKGPNGKSHS